MAELVSRRFSSFFFSHSLPIFVLPRSFASRIPCFFFLFFFPSEIYSIRRFKLILILYRDGADGEIVAVFLTSVEARRRDEG